ncbi:MAG TPA: TonB-dependent receptor [Lacunisphaera sp.]|nr:TonB-dependent receptor [Lacunisphaera sp.]
MRLHSKYPLSCALAAVMATALVGPSPLAAQQQSGTVPEDTVRLSDFIVTAEKFSSYGATNAYTATRIGVPIIKTPLNIQVVSGELIRDQGVRDFQGALKFVSGVHGDSLNIDAGTMNIQGSGTFNIRGFVPSIFLCNGFRRPASLASENVERIEIVKGPASVFFGQAAPGGLINVITRKPSDTPSATIDYTYGSYDFNKARLDVTGPLGNSGVSYRLYASHEDSKDWRDFVGGTRTTIAPSLMWKPTDRLTFVLDYEFSDVKWNHPPYTAIGNQQFIADYENPPAEAQTALNMTAAQLRTRWRTTINNWINDRTTWTGVMPFRITDYIHDISPRGLEYNAGGPEQYYSHETHSATIEAIYELNDHLSFRYGGNYFKHDRFDLVASLGVTNADRTINLALQNQRNDQTWDIHQFDTVIKHDLSFVKNKFVVGFQYTRDRDLQYAGVFNPAGYPLGGTTAITQYNAYTMPPLRISQVPVTVGVLTSDRNQKNFTRGYAFSWFGEWGESQRLTTMVGVRHEKDVRERLGLPVLETLRRSATTPTFGATYQVVKGISLFGSYSENFAPNSLRTASGGGLLPSDNAQDLPVEMGEGYDVGIKSEWLDSRLTGSLSVYQVERVNVPRADTAREVADPRNINGLSLPGSVRFTVPGGLERTRGVELDLVYVPIRNYQMLLSASHMWESRVVKDPAVIPNTVNYERTYNQGRRLKNTPEYTFAFWNKYDFTTGSANGLSLGFGIRYTSEIQPRPQDLTTMLENPSFTVASAMLSYTRQFGRHKTTFAVNVDNLFDDIYYEGNTAVSDRRKIFFRVGTTF